MLCRLGFGPLLLLLAVLLAWRSRRPAVGRAACDDAKIQLAAIDVDAGHGDLHGVAQTILVAGTVARERVRRSIVAIEIVGQRRDVHQAFGGQVDTFHEEAEFFAAGDAGLRTIVDGTVGKQKWGVI